MRISNREIVALSVEECQRLDAALRDDLEALDFEIRSLVARVRLAARDDGADDIVVVKASTTVLLSIAAGLIACAAEDRKALFDVRAFAASADHVATWARERWLKGLAAAGEA